VLAQAALPAREAAATALAAPPARRSAAGAKHNQARPSQAGLERRACGCGGSAGPTGECESCRRHSAPDAQEAQAQRAAERAGSTGAVPSLGAARLHADAHAALLADSVSAAAFTIGRDVYFGPGRYAPETAEGRRLIAHELAHVRQQEAAAPRIQRQALPDDFDLAMRLEAMTDVELQQRYDAITQVLAKAIQSTPENVRLEKEAGEIGAILARRAGRTFSAADVERMKKFFVANAKSASPLSCIACLNQGVRLVLDLPKQKVGSEVDVTARLLEASGHAGPVRSVGFFDAKGRPTSGTLSPVKLRESVWDVLLAMAGGDRGWSVFVMSLMDGYHSVTLSLDNNDPVNPKVYWSDQWSEKGGFKEYTKATLDAEIEHLTHAWWEEEAAGTGESAQKTGKAIRMNTDVKLYRLIGTPHPVGPPPASSAPPPPLWTLPPP
jgi:hypothetical protein